MELVGRIDDLQDIPWPNDCAESDNTLTANKTTLSITSYSISYEVQCEIHLQTTLSFARMRQRPQPRDTPTFQLANIIHDTKWRSRKCFKTCATI